MSIYVQVLLRLGRAAVSFLVEGKPSIMDIAQFY
jgi:hypothetical protein